MNLLPARRDVTRFTNDESGQLLLVGAVVIVVGLVAVSLVLNTVLFTSNIEAQETFPEGELSKEYVQTLESEYSTALYYENTQGYTSEQTANRQTLNSLYDINDLMATQLAESQGVYATIEPIQTTNATIIRHTDASCSFESAKSDCGTTSSNSDPIADYNYIPSTPEAGQQIDFDGSPSSDSDGSIASYEWDFDNDGSIDAMGVNPSYTYSSAGEYTASITVTDDGGATDTHTETITVETTSSNQAPSADFTYSPNNPKANDQITFDGGSSSDGDGFISSYEWDIDDDGTYEKSGDSVTHKYSSKGDRAVTLRVTDNDGATNTLTKQISVKKNNGNGNGNGGPPFSFSGPNIAPSAGAAAVSTEDWTLVETSRPRKFQFQLDKTDISNTISDSDLTSQSILRSSAFHVHVTGDTGEEWRVYLYRSSADELVVATQQNDEQINIHYRNDTASATIDITTGKVNGSDVGFAFAPNVDGPYTISYRNGDTTKGTYYLVVPDSPSETTNLESDNFNAPGDDQSPYVSEGTYSTRLRVTFDVERLSYSTIIRIAPHEPPSLEP